MGGGVVAKEQGSGAIDHRSGGPVATVRGDQPLTGGHVAPVPPLYRVGKASTLLSILRGDDLEIAVWHIEGIRQDTMAEWLNVSRRKIQLRIAAIRQTLALHGLVLPDPPAVATDSRHVRFHDPSGCVLN